MATNTGDDETWERHGLATPKLDEDGQVDWNLVWLYHDKGGVRQPRPIFTGDVFIDVPTIGEDEPSTVVILQHPCALLDKSNEIRSTLLTAKVIGHQETTPKDWAGNYDIMPLVLHDDEPREHLAVAFDQLALVQSSDLTPKRRVACMEIEAVACLLQRWMNVNTRVVVPTWRIKQVIDTQFAEAEGMESWCTQRQSARVKPAEAMKEATGWLDEKSEDTGTPRRELLRNPDYRKRVLRNMIEVPKQMTKSDNIERARIKAETKAQAEKEASSDKAPARHIDATDADSPS